MPDEFDWDAFNDDLNAPDLDLAIDAEEDKLVRCLCSGEHFDQDKARRLGCDQAGGCPELRDSMEGLF